MVEGTVFADAGYGMSAPSRQALGARRLAWAVDILRHQKALSRVLEQPGSPEFQPLHPLFLGEALVDHDVDRGFYEGGGYRFVESIQR